MEFKLPELGEGVHEGELVKWRVKPGERVTHDQPLCEVMTDKATIEIPSAFEGKVAELHVKEGAVVKVGQLMLTFEGKIATEATGATGAVSAGPATPAERKPQGLPAQAPAQQTAVGPQGEILAAPSTRRYAREAGVDLSRVHGSGPHGRILMEDVERATRGETRGRAEPARPSAPMPSAARTISNGGEERVPLAGLRKRIAEKMRLSKDHAAHFTYVEEADATQLVKLRTDAKEIGAKQGIKVTYLPFIMKAMVEALKAYPIVNSTLDEEKGEIIFKHYYNIGLSIQTEEGLTAPVVKDVEGKSVLELAREIQDLVERARQKRLTREDFLGGTITLTNAGSIGGLFATPVINYPEVAILGFNKIFRKPVVVEHNGREEVAIRDWTYFSISLDHRVVDGAIGAEFMKLFIRYIENPSLLLLGR